MNDGDATRFFHLIQTDGPARRGEVSTLHGTFQTPAFMPVGTSGAVKGLTAEHLEQCSAEIILGNTYHLYLRPGQNIVRSLGGLARFSGWNRPTLTDSGGYQIFSMRDISKVSDEGVEFRSHLDGSSHFFTPEKVIEIEHDLGADIIMPLDQCVPYPVEEPAAAVAVRRTSDWARRCRSVHAARSRQDSSGIRLFGIVQGSVYQQLRTQSAEEIVAMDFDGYAIGGLSVGESKQEMEDTLAHTVEFLPSDKPRYLMGVGYPEDILMAVGYGVDMFDCVLPTRNARTGNVFTSQGQLTYRNADCADDEHPLDPNCDCLVCRRYSRAYLRHLYNQSEITGMVLATFHSTYFYQQMMRNIRQAIQQQRLSQFRRDFLANYTTS
ncbi:MAG: tRNA guanosine(34) transglycosylase Tgt [bacterium]